MANTFLKAGSVSNPFKMQDWVPKPNQTEQLLVQH